MALAFRTEHHLLDRADEVILRHLLPILACGQYRPFVHERVELGAREAGRALGDDRESNVRPKGLLPRMDLQNLFAVAPVGQVDGDPAVEASGAKQCWVKNV